MSSETRGLFQYKSIVYHAYVALSLPTECLRNAILHNYEEIRDEIDVRIAEYTDPPCHAACEKYKDSSDRYRSPQALLKHVLECETALVRFKKVTRSTPIAGLTESDCTCSGNGCRKMVALNASFEKQLIRSTSLNPAEIKLRSPYF